VIAGVGAVENSFQRLEMNSQQPLVSGLFYFFVVGAIND
jgi:hypothetical protein